MPDTRIQAAIANWAPRFTAQGVDPNDFLATTMRLERWEDWLDAWCATADVHAGLARDAEARGRTLTAGEAWVRAALCYHFAKFVWMLDEGKHRAAAAKAVTSLYAAHRFLDRTAERVDIPLDAAKMVGNLRRPPGAPRPPLVLLLPGLDSTKEEFFHWENVFIARGMATFSLDGPGQGETGYVLPIRADYEVAVSATLDTLSRRADVDTQRVGAAGVSLGGYYAPRAAAFEPRLRATAAIGGPYAFGRLWDSLPSLTRATFAYHAHAKSDDDARAKATALDLSGVLARIRQPLLVVFGRRDVLIPWQDAEQVAKEAPNAELMMYPDGNHVCNNIPYKYRPLVADWMKERLA